MKKYKEYDVTIYLLQLYRVMLQKKLSDRIFSIISFFLLKYTKNRSYPLSQSRLMNKVCA